MKSKNKCYAIILTFLLCIGLCACGQKESKTIMDIPEKIGDNLIHSGNMKLDYATEFAIDYYKDIRNEEAYSLISVKGEGAYLITNQKEMLPEDLPKDVVIISAPRQIYLVASQVMDMMSAIEATECIRFSALDRDSWYIEDARTMMDTGTLLYAGKYSAPDYEMIMEQGCDLAVENTMIYHSPEVKEKLEAFGIPVFVDHSSYEQNPLGRMEWVKVYGEMLGKGKEAEQVFERQLQACESFVGNTDTKQRPTVAFFYIASNGSVKVRKSADYVPKMIEMAGGSYVFSDLGGTEENASSTVNMQMEEFYSRIKDVDYLIYNSTIEGELNSVEDLLAKCELLQNVKAVKKGKVYCTSQNMYQCSMETGTIISDIGKMLRGEEDLRYLMLLKAK